MEVLAIPGIPVSILSATLNRDQVDGESIEIRFVPLEIAAKFLPELTWERNPKKGDIGAMTSAIMKYGFQDPPKWDDRLNGGKGGLVYGNHRFIAAVQSMLELVRLGQPLPQGIPLAKRPGEWSDVAWKKGEPCIPVKFGVNTSSEEEAIAFALDHNALTLSGGDFGPLDITTRLYDPQPLAELLEQIAPIEEAIVMDGDALDSLLGSLRRQDGVGGDDGEEEDGEERDRGGFQNKQPIPLVVSPEIFKRWESFAQKVGLKKSDKILEKLLDEAGA